MESFLPPELVSTSYCYCGASTTFPPSPCYPTSPYCLVVVETINQPMSLVYLVYISNSSGSRTDSSFLVVLNPVLRRTQII